MNFRASEERPSPGIRVISAIFAVAGVLGIAVTLIASAYHGYVSAIGQGIGAALFTAGMIAFPLALIGHRAIISAARENLRELLATSADKILEERLSRPHIETLRTDTFGKPIIEHYRFLITLDVSADLTHGQPGIGLTYRREYLVKNNNAAPTLMDLLHHTSGPVNPAPAGQPVGFTYAYLEMGDEVLQWDANSPDSAWTRSDNGRFERTWCGTCVSIGREPSLGNIFTIRASDLRIGPDSTLQAIIISETQVSHSGAEPFVVLLPTMELEIVVMCSPDIEVDLFPMYALQPPFAALMPSRRLAAHGGRMKEISWRWGKALFAGQGVILRWNLAEKQPHSEPAGDTLSVDVAAPESAGVA